MISSYFRPTPGGETIFTVDPRPIKFGPGAIDELGSAAKSLGLRRVVVFTDTAVRELAVTQKGLDSLARAGIETVLFR